MSDELVKVEKEPWLTRGEWALALFPPLVWWAALRTVTYQLRMRRRGGNTDRDWDEIRRRMGHRNFAAYRRICLINFMVLGVAGWAFGWTLGGIMFALAATILFMPSPEGMKKLRAEKEKKMLDG